METPDQDGVIEIDGNTYNLRKLERDELKNIQTALEADIDNINSQLSKRDVEAGIVGEYDYGIWRIKARLAINIKRRQITFIHAEFLRRKRLTPPLSDFAFAAVHQLYGEDARLAVEETARALQAEYVTRVNRLGMPVGSGRKDRRRVCGNKTGHPYKKDALAAIKSLEQDNQDTDGMVVYQCPFCAQWHTGHKKGSDWHKRTEQEPTP